MDVDEFLAGVRERMGARQVFAEPVERDGVTVIPAATVRGGGGGGSDNAANGGGGFGLSARPVGAYVIRDGEVTWQPATDPLRVLLGWQLLAGLTVLTAWRLLRR